MTRHDIIVMGGSAGGFQAIAGILCELPAEMPAVVCVVLHMAPRPNHVAEILAKKSHMRVKFADDHEPWEQGTVYVARSDHHLLITGDILRVVRGPKENLHRPSVDTLFRSAAYTHGPRVIAVVLSGNLDDGSSGLWAVKSHGGTTIAQDPDDSQFPSMPANAISYSSVDHVEPVANIPSLLQRLVGGETREAGQPMREDNKKEVRITESELDGPPPDAREFGTPSFFTCPSCSGTLWEFAEGHLTRYRCRTGHVFSIDSMITEQASSLERALWIAVRTLDEKADMMKRLAERSRKLTPMAAQRLEARQQESEENAQVLRDMLKSMNEIDTD